MKVKVKRETLQGLFDIAVGSMDFGSGFLDKEDVDTLRAVARVLGVDEVKATPSSYLAAYPHLWHQECALTLALREAPGRPDPSAGAAVVNATRKETIRGCTTALITAIAVDLVTGYLFMIAVGVAHHEWIPILPTVGYLWAVVLVTLTRGLFAARHPAGGATSRERHRESPSDPRRCRYRGRWRRTPHVRRSSHHHPRPDRHDRMALPGSPTGIVAKGGPHD